MYTNIYFDRSLHLNVNVRYVFKPCIIYCRILKSLLNELIDKSVEKKHPKLMLRRSV